MVRHHAETQRCRGFTLVEILVVIGIIAILASMLLPAMFAVSQEAKIANATALLNRIRVALDFYTKSYIYYPPDFIAPTSGDPPAPLIYNLQGARTGSPPSLVKVNCPGALPPEALYYFLCHRYMSNEHPMLPLQSRREALDINNNGLPEIVDPWGRPYLYNRPPFPTCSDDYFNFTGSFKFGNLQCIVLSRPWYNKDTYDLYSVGPDGQTGFGDLPDCKESTFFEFCVRAMDSTHDGNAADDIRNWK